MKRLTSLLTILILSSSTALGAQVDSQSDIIGVFFDLNGAGGGCAAYQAPYTPVSAYVMALNPSRPGGISGWEATILVYPTSFPAGITFDAGPGAVNSLAMPYFRVGLSPPRTGNPILLLTITTFYLGGEILFGIGPCVPSSFGGLTPGYWDAADPGDLVALQPLCWQPWTRPAYGEAAPITAPANSCVSACNYIWCCPPDESEGSSWGSVKALYR